MAHALNAAGAFISRALDTLAVKAGKHRTKESDGQQVVGDSEHILGATKHAVLTTLTKQHDQEWRQKAAQDKDYQEWMQEVGDGAWAGTPKPALAPGERHAKVRRHSSTSYSVTLPVQGGTPSSKTVYSERPFDAASSEFSTGTSRVEVPSPLLQFNAVALPSETQSAPERFLHPAPALTPPLAAISITDLSRNVVHSHAWSSRPTADEPERGVPSEAAPSNALTPTPRAGSRAGLHSRCCNTYGSGGQPQRKPSRASSENPYASSAAEDSRNELSSDINSGEFRLLSDATLPDEGSGGRPPMRFAPDPCANPHQHANTPAPWRMAPVLPPGSSAGARRASIDMSCLGPSSAVSRLQVAYGSAPGGSMLSPLAPGSPGEPQAGCSISSGHGSPVSPGAPLAPWCVGPRRTSVADAQLMARPGTSSPASPQSLTMQRLGASSPVQGAWPPPNGVNTTGVSSSPVPPPLSARPLLACRSMQSREGGGAGMPALEAQAGTMGTQPGADASQPSATATSGGSSRLVLPSLQDSGVRQHSHLAPQLATERPAPLPDPPSVPAPAQAAALSGRGIAVLSLTPAFASGRNSPGLGLLPAHRVMSPAGSGRRSPMRQALPHRDAALLEELDAQRGDLERARQNCTVRVLAAARRMSLETKAAPAVESKGWRT